MTEKLPKTKPRISQKDVDQFLTKLELKEEADDEIIDSLSSDQVVFMTSDTFRKGASFEDF